MKKNIRFVSYLLLPSLLLSAAACTDSNVVDNTDPATTNSDGQIVVKVASDDFLASRAGVGKAFPLTETSEGTLALVVVDTPMGAASPAATDDDRATRGVPITTDNFGEEYGKFKIVGYLAGSNSTTGAPMPTTDVLYNSVSEDYPWTPDCPPCYWPTSGDAVDFWAYAPAVCSGRSTPAIDGADGTMSFDYTLPAHQTDNEDAKRELDLMVAAELGIDATDHNGEVVLKFKHALSTISFQTKRVPDGAVKTIALKGIYNAGTCTYTPSLDPASPSYVPSTDASYDEDNDPSAGISWVLETTKGNFTQKFGPDDDGQEVSSSGTTQLTGKDPTRTFVVIPQTAPDDAYLELDFEWDSEYITNGDRTQKFVVDLSDFEWKAGHSYSYNIITIPYETANCYMASTPGLHLVPAYCMGNRQDYVLSAPEGHTYKVAVLWSDCGLSPENRADGSAVSQSAVTDLNYFVMDDGKGYFVYRVAEDGSGNAVRGNVVVALYDENATAPETGKPEIIWTWHIWLTEQPGTMYTNGACDEGSYSTDGYSFDAQSVDGNLAIFDRNLGATSANPADGWKTFGLYYQNGRRDPFIGINPALTLNSYSTTGLTSGTFSDGGGKTVYLDETTPFDPATSTRTYWNDALSDGWQCYTFAVTTTGGNNKITNATQTASVFDIPWSIHEPMTFSGNSLFGMQWTKYDDIDNLRYMDSRIETTYATHGMTGLTYGGHQAYWSRFKTIMDPCPAGWTVLGDNGGNFGGGEAAGIYLGKNTSATFLSSGGVNGVTTSHTGNESIEYCTWWPAAGVRATNGCMASVGISGFYLYYDHVAANHGGHGMYYTIANTTKVEWNTGQTTNHATPVRCVRSYQDKLAGGGKKPKK